MGEHAKFQACHGNFIAERLRVSQQRYNFQVLAWNPQKIARQTCVIEGGNFGSIRRIKRHRLLFVRVFSNRSRMTQYSRSMK